jgi:hypothetical protein
MAAKTLTDLVTITDETPGQVGNAELRCTPDQRITVTANADYASIGKHFVRFGDNWIELCGRCGGSGNVGYGPYNGL